MSCYGAECRNLQTAQQNPVTIVIFRAVASFVSQLLKKITATFEEKDLFANKKPTLKTYLHD